MRKLFILLFLLGGCCHRPCPCEMEIDIPNQWESPLTCNMEPSVLEDFVWWDALEDPILNSLIEKASIKNLDLNSAALRILQARLERNGMSGASLPHIDASVSVGELGFNRKILKEALGSCVGSRTANVGFFEAGFDADWEIDFFGVNKHKIGALEARIHASEENYFNLWCTLTAEIARNYIELRGQQKQLQIIQNLIAANQDNVVLTEELVRIGIKNTADRKISEEQFNRMNARKPQVELAIQKSIHRLSILTGLYPSQLVCELTPLAPLPKLPCVLPVGIPTELLRNRPDIRKAEQDLAAAMELEESAIASLYPRFSIKGFIGDISTKCGSSGVYFITPQLLFPLFNSRMLEKDVEMSKTETQIALLEYHKVILNAFEEVENALAALKSSQERKSYLQKALESDEEALYSISDLYNQGFNSYFEVLTIQQALYSSEEELLQINIELLLEYVSLYKSLGGSKWMLLDNCL
ncbi:MAG: TolC family protein [Parachlamydiales bacterium]